MCAPIKALLQRLFGEVVLVKTDSWVCVVQNAWEDLASLLELTSLET